MSKRIYVGGLPYSVTQSQLADIFGEFGNVVSADVITDKYTNQSKGFGFVEMKKDSEGEEAISKLNDTEIEGRKITVNEARPREERAPYGGGGGNNRSFRGGNRNRGR